MTEKWGIIIYKLPVKIADAKILFIFSCLYKN